MKPFSFLSGSLSAVFLFSAVLPANALYFYMDSTQRKCFFEEMPKDTLVVGHFSTAVYNPNSKEYVTAQQPVEMLITIDEIFDSNHRVYNMRSPPTGKFTFTAADSGDHKLCFQALNAPNQGGWLTSGSPAGAIKFTLDMAIGDTSDLNTGDKEHLDEIVEKVRELNNRLENIRREQVHQREREKEFREQSELANSRFVRWSIVQLVVLGVTCAWQLSHLRSFFIKQKLT